jgi:hypothetical protein
VSSPFRPGLLQAPCLGESPRSHEIFRHAALLELVPNGVCIVQTGRLEEPLKVVYWWLSLAFEAAFRGHDVLLVGVMHFLVIVVIVAGNNYNQSRAPLSPMLAPRSATLDGATQQMSRTASQSPGTRTSPTTSSPGACWAVMSSSSSVVYLMTLFNAWMCCGNHASHRTLPNAFGPIPLGLRLCPSWLSCPPGL